VLARRCYRLDLRGLCTNMCKLHTWKIVYVIDATVVEVLAVVFFFSFSVCSLDESIINKPSISQNYNHKN